MTKHNPTFCRSTTLLVFQLIHHLTYSSNSTISKMLLLLWTSLKNIKIKLLKCRKKHVSKELSLGKKLNLPLRRGRTRKFRRFRRRENFRRNILGNFKEFIPPNNQSIITNNLSPMPTKSIKYQWEEKESAKSSKKLKNPNQSLNPALENPTFPQLLISSTVNPSHKENSNPNPAWI